MDPNANLKEQLELAKAIVNDDLTHEGLTDTTWQLAELVLALDEWRRKGGFDPYIQTRQDSLKARSAYLERERRELGNRRMTGE